MRGYRPPGRRSSTPGVDLLIALLPCDVVVYRRDGDTVAEVIDPMTTVPMSCDQALESAPAGGGGPMRPRPRAAPAPSIRRE